MGMTEQDRLFRLAVEAVHVRADFRHREGWHVVIGARRGDETWTEAPQRTYDHLTTEELFDVLCADLAAALGL